MKNHWLWTLLWAGLLFFSLISRPLLPIDETRYLSVAWEMWHHNQFLVPHSNGLPYSQKPPLLFWLIQFSWWLFGVNQWSARLIAPLFNLGSIILTIRLTHRLQPHQKETGQTVPFILTGMLFWSLYGTLTLFDMLIVFFSLAAYLGLLNSVQKKASGWILFSLAIGLGILAKGPVILLFTVPPALLAPWWANCSDISWPRWYSTLFLALAGGIGLALCWAIPAAQAGGPVYGHAILLGQTTGRVVHSFAHQRPFYWYVLLLPLLFFPWFFWLPLWRGIKQFKLNPPNRFCLSIIVPAFILFSCVSGKQIHYLLPLLPIAAILSAEAIIHHEAPVRFIDRCLAALIPILFGLSLLFVATQHLHGGDVHMLGSIPPLIGTIPLLAGFIMVIIYSRKELTQIKIVTTINILMLIILQLAISPTLFTLYDPSPAVTAVQSAQRQGYLVAVTPARQADQFQFAGRLTESLPVKQTLEEMVIWAQKNPRQYCLIYTTNKRHELLKGQGTETRYKDGWLIFRPARGLAEDYQAWISALNKVSRHDHFFLPETATQFPARSTAG